MESWAKLFGHARPSMIEGQGVGVDDRTKLYVPSSLSTSSTNSRNTTIRRI